MLKNSFAVVMLTLLGGWSLAEKARGQCCGIPTHVGATRMPDPVPLERVKALPPLIPGPLSPLAAPPGPKQDLSLPENHPSAFQSDNYPPDEHFYFHVGVLALQRQRLGNTPLIFGDPTNPDGLDTGVGVDGRSILQDLDNLTTTQDLGGLVTIGYLCGDYSVELTGFYKDQGGDNIASYGTGQANLLFFNAPLGFVGNNGLFRQADIVETEIKTALGSLELNVRYHNTGFTHVEPIVGIRYLDIAEAFEIYVDDDSVSFPPLNGFRVATYSSITDNRIIGPQIGAELQGNILPGVALGIYGKVAAGANFANVRIRLKRGDGVTALNNHGRSRINFSQIYEAGLNLDVYLLERLRVRGGYQVLFASQVLEAADQVDYNLANPLGRQDNTGNIFFHGPRVEFQFLF